jgi:hypothetical protein
MSTVCDDEGNFIHAVEVPHSDVQKLINKHDTPENMRGCAQAQDFVEILTGESKGYCGTVTSMNVITDALTVEVKFPTGRKFIVAADVTSVKKLPKTPIKRRAFWGVLGA